MHPFVPFIHVPEQHVTPRGSGVSTSIIDFDADFVIQTRKISERNRRLIPLKIRNALVQDEPPLA